MKKARGFTLIELLVVIAILAVLAAFLYPVFARAREKGRQSKCLSNIKQLGAAMQMYLDDWDGWFPPFLAYQKPEHPELNWAGSYGLGPDMQGPGQKCDPTLGQLYPYVRNTKVYLCPDMVGVDLPRISPDALPYPVSYAINNMLIHAATGGPWDPFNVSRVVVPARVGLFCEKNFKCLDEPEINWGGWAGHTDEINPGHNTPSDVHNGGSNVVYCDLHAKWQSYDSIIQAFKNDDWNPEKP